MAVGKDVMYFALLDNDEIVDCIPLFEILHIKHLGVDGGLDSSLQRSRGSISNTQLSCDLLDRALRIDTKPEGYNSGRTYYLQLASDEECARLAISLTTYVQDAIKRFEAKTGLERSQAKVRIVYNSTVFQCSASFFIIAVSPSSLQRNPWTPPD
jgi:hypothetical protein